MNGPSNLTSLITRLVAELSALSCFFDVLMAHNTVPHTDWQVKGSLVKHGE
jgi:hypothetical protein